MQLAIGDLPSSRLVQGPKGFSVPVSYTPGPDDHTLDDEKRGAADGVIKAFHWLGRDLEQELARLLRRAAEGKSYRKLRTHKAQPDTPRLEGRNDVFARLRTVWSTSTPMCPTTPMRPVRMACTFA